MCEAPRVSWPSPFIALVARGHTTGTSRVCENEDTCQWRRNGTPISGATGTTYSIPSCTLAHAGTYDALITNGCFTVTSNPATLTVDDFCPADFDQSGAVNPDDLAEFINVFFGGGCP